MNLEAICHAERENYGRAWLRFSENVSKELLDAYANTPKPASARAVVGMVFSALKLKLRSISPRVSESFLYAASSVFS